MEALSTHKSIMDGRPVRVFVYPDETIEVVYHKDGNSLTSPKVEAEHESWRFDRNLQPVVRMYNENFGQEYELKVDGAILARKIMDKEYTGGSDEFKNDGSYRSDEIFKNTIFSDLGFWSALDAIESVKDLPANIRAKFEEIRKYDGVSM